jgi:hypothetical protein
MTLLQVALFCTSGAPTSAASNGFVSAISFGTLSIIGSPDINSLRLSLTLGQIPGQTHRLTGYSETSGQNTKPAGVQSRSR